ncbi:hypothetical protein AAFF_G00299080 [Aldrovandia affinis]|uniref:Cardiotrophin-like cytokine factor 1 n=1 Tax=Aldrovandia affinis TaxID=143900 RepID=A0AAD7W193_9TELE|nr:hypothetical protein AAFF_G00299080 [Aldrovandia affinis]
MRRRDVHHVQLALLLAVVAVSAQVPDPSLSLSNERSSIERTYELTKYLEHQLREIKDTYLSYLGPPFSDPDFSPPRPNSTALTLPSAATRLDLWRGLENRARLDQNHRAYSVLLGAVRELARGTLCPYLQSSLMHFSAGLDGLLGSISGLMTTLGYALPPPHHGLGRRDREGPRDTRGGQEDRAAQREERGRGAERARARGGEGEGRVRGREGHRSCRSWPRAAWPPPAALLSALSSAPLLHGPSLNDFSRKVESFWLLRELQSWLWRSAKDFNRLKKRLRA